MFSLEDFKFNEPAIMFDEPGIGALILVSVIKFLVGILILYAIKEKFKFGNYFCQKKNNFVAMKNILYFLLFLQFFTVNLVKAQDAATYTVMYVSGVVKSQDTNKPIKPPEHKYKKKK